MIHVLHTMLAVAAPDPLTRWEAVLGLLVSVLVLVGALWRTGRRIARGIEGQVTSTRANTAAIDALTDRVEALERHLPLPPVT